VAITDLQRGFKETTTGTQHGNWTCYQPEYSTSRTTKTKNIFFRQKPGGEDTGAGGANIQVGGAAETGTHQL